MVEIDGDAGLLRSDPDEPGWEVDPDDEWGVAVIGTVGRQLRLRRGVVGMRVPDLATAPFGPRRFHRVTQGPSSSNYW